MSRGLPDQLDAYFSDVDANQGPVTPDHVADLLEQVRELPPNPIPDPTGFDSAETEQGSLPMARDEQISTKSSSTKPVHGGNRRNGLLVGAVAALLVLVVGLASWAAFGGNDDDAVASEVAVAIASFEAINNGDIDGYLELFTEDAAARQSRRSQQVLVNLNNQTELVEPCRLIEPSLTTDAARVECSVSVSSDFHSPGGIEMIRTAAFDITDAGKIAVSLSSFDSGSGTESSFFAYNSAFWQWLADAHPSVADAIAPSDFTSMPGWLTEPEDVFTALDYVDEFIAQSDVYPLTDASTP